MQAESIRARLHVDATGWRPSADDISMLPVVQDAIARDVKLSFQYRKADGEIGPRTVEPYGVVCKQTVWYLVARAQAGMRTYRLSRMSDVVALAIPFKRMAKFNLAEYWNASTAQLAQAKESCVATLGLALEAVKSLSGWCQLTAASGIREDTLPESWAAFHVGFESSSQAQFVALGLGSKACVLAPGELRRKVEEEIRALASVRIRSDSA